jgi:hypothetical protein
VRKSKERDKQMDHKIELEVRKHYVSASCKCGQWSKFANKWRGVSESKIEYVKNEYKNHKSAVKN